MTISAKCPAPGAVSGGYGARRRGGHGTWGREVVTVKTAPALGPANTAEATRRSPSGRFSPAATRHEGRNEQAD
ncbi:hypothetical protein GCM10012285_33280 [Streptomyces kronopolitis]|uniref:Uncharacterized protein n=1 Tax=Streptomyces kronopolitis TaxID=1612435 RepID=A0ABQ2JKF6_9ACTN|nr:hypothetical protein GCM10012285_33280 [Streptomyces kronopolitis]